MRKIFNFLSALILMFGATAQADTMTELVTVGTRQMTLNSLIGYGLPVLCVETVDGEEPTCERVYAPAGSWGSTINSVKVPGRMVMYSRIAGGDSVLYDSGDYEKSVSGMTIKIRGNTSALGEKKPYKIKLQKKFDLLMRGVDSVYKDKEWLLLKDENLYTNYGFKVSELVGMVWVPGHRYVNVVINNIYRGVYLLTEAVKRNPDCRLKVDKNSGFIFECDIYWWNESVYVLSYDSPNYNYIFKYPEEEDVTQEQLDYMQQVVYAYESSLDADNYPDLIDVRSFAAWCLVHDLVGTLDGGGCNRFYTKNDTTDTSKIVMPVAWDFDMAERTPRGWSRCHEVYMKKLFNNSNHAFIHEYLRLWYTVREGFADEIQNFYFGFVNSSLGYALQSSYSLDNMTWNRDIMFQNMATFRRQWLTTRVAWIDANIKALHVPNDVNIDGVVNIADVTELINMLLSDQKMMTGDIDENGSVTIADVTALINLLLNG